jgi:hypothetical protein
MGERPRGVPSVVWLGSGPPTPARTARTGGAAVDLADASGAGFPSHGSHVR